VLQHYQDKARLKSVPWSFVAQHEVQARRNHHQSIERLAQRGGLCPAEMIAVVTDRDWLDVPQMDNPQANAELARLLAEHNGRVAVDEK
jgi:hypothetical protein